MCDLLNFSNKRTSSLFCLIFFAFFNGFAQVSDTIAVQWERMDAPKKGIFTSYAQQGAVLFAISGAERLYQSHDFGRNWELAPAANTGSVYSIYITEDFILLARSAPTFGVYRSDDGGLSYNLVLELPPLSGGSGMGTRIPWISQVYQKDSDNLYVINQSQYLAGENVTHGIIYHSADAGLTWQATEVEAHHIAFSEDKVWANKLSSLFYSTATDFSNPIEVTIGYQEAIAPDLGFFIVNNTLVFLQSQGYLSRSTDLGDTWQIDTLSFNQITAVQRVGDDFYFTDRKGLFKTNNTWTSFEQLYHGEHSPKFVRNLAILESGIYMDSMTGATLRSTDHGQNWEVMNWGLGHSLMNGVYTVGTEIWATGKLGQIHHSNEGNNWQLVKSSNFYDVIEEGAYLSKPMKEFISINDTILSSSSNSLNSIFRSTDHGDSWQVVFEDGRSYDDVYVENGKVYYVGADIEVSEDLGNTWQTIITPNIAKTVIPFGDTLLLTETLMDGSRMTMKRSSDYGENWEEMVSLDVNFLKVFKKGQKAIGVSTQGAVYVSLNRGDSWLMTGEPLVEPDIYLSNCHLVDDLFIIRKGNTTYISKNEGLDWKVLRTATYNTYSSQWLIKEDYLYNIGKTNQAGEYLYRTPLAPIHALLDLNATNSGTLIIDVYKDIDFNCEKNTNDLAIKEKTIKINPHYLGATNQAGRLVMDLPTGNYDLETTGVRHHLANCGGTIIPNIVVSVGDTQRVDFPFQIIPNIYDISANLTSRGAVRPGFTNTYRITLKNHGTETAILDEVIFYFNPEFFSIIDFPEGGQVQDGQFIFPATLAPDECINVELTLQNSPLLPLGTVETFQVEAMLTNDIQPADNVEQISQTVTGSYDPNDKTLLSESPPIPLSAHRMDYLIRFQNTGTDTAFTVVVVDTLSNHLDVLSLNTIATSHLYQFKLESPNVATWTFDNILLPDSTTNEAASHGFIRFAIDTEDNLWDGDSILNDAAIYFDFNEAVITNEVHTKIEKRRLEFISTVQLCVGDTWNGESIYQNTTFQEMVSTPTVDSLWITNIELYPSEVIQIDTVLDMGTVFQGQTVLSDTIIMAQFINSFGCDSMIYYFIDVLVSSTANFEKAQKVSIFPNPFSDLFQLEILHLSGQHALDIQLLDATGKLCLQKNISTIDGKASIATQDLPSGLYFIKIQTGQAEYVLKVIKS